MNTEKAISNLYHKIESLEKVVSEQSEQLQKIAEAVGLANEAMKVQSSMNKDFHNGITKSFEEISITRAVMAVLSEALGIDDEGFAKIATGGMELESLLRGIEKRGEKPEVDQRVDEIMAMARELKV